MPAQERSPAECADGFVSVLLENRACFFWFFLYTLNTAVAACIFAADICFCKAGFFGQRYSLVNYPLCNTFLQFSFKNLLRPVQDKIFQKTKKLW